MYTIVLQVSLTGVVSAGGGMIPNRNRKLIRLFIESMRRMFKSLASLLIVVSMVATPVASVLASTDTGSAAYVQDTNVVPCHEMDSEDVVKDESTQTTGTHPCKDCCKDGACQESLCSSCAHFAQLPAISPLTFLAPHGISDSYKSDLFDSHPSLILSPAFRPPIR